MPPRTIASARAALDDMLPHLSDYQVAEARKVLAQLEREARNQATAYVTDREREVREARDSALRELTAVRDAMDELAAEGSTGRVSAQEYAQRLNGLAGRQFKAEDLLTKAEAKVELVEQIETDPIGWFDDLTARTHTWQDVPW
jgi:hypothetical protein